MPHFPALDGWRGISILLVLAAHMLPLGPKSLELNSAIAAAGMALFFTLSGFLITSTLIFDPSVPRFLTRRIFRIVPLAWLYMLLVIPYADFYRAQLLFYANLPPFWLGPFTGHLWSLDVEMQFYVCIALIALVFRRRGLLLLPLIGLAITCNRIIHGETINITTWFRVDEILAGATLALLMHWPDAAKYRRVLRFVNPYLWIILLFLSGHDRVPYLAYARPYLAASLVGATLVRRHSHLSVLLETASLRYIAKISYALYVLHEVSMAGWLGSGSTIVRYAKRPLCFALTFLAAHVSTNYYERFWIKWGKKLSIKASPVKTAGLPVQV